MGRSKNRKKNGAKTDAATKTYLSIFGAIFILVFMFHLSRNHNVRIEAPSDKWSKEVSVSTADIRTYTRIITDDSGKIFVAYNDGNKAVVQGLDSKGQKLSEKRFPSEGDNINNISINESKDSMFLSWNTFKDGKNNLVIKKLDKNLNETFKETVPGVIESKQIDKDLVAVLSENGVAILDFKNGDGKKTVDIKSVEPSLITGTKKGDDYYIAYLEKDGELKCFKYDGKAMKIAGESSTFGKVNRSVDISYFNSAIAVDDRNAYFIIEGKKKDNLNEPSCYSIPLSGGEVKNTVMRLDGYDDLNELAGSSDKDGARFYANASYRVYRKENSNIIEFKVKDGVPSQVERATRSDHGPSLKSVYGNYVSYSDFASDGKQKLFISSSNDDFKTANGGTRMQEKKMALADTMGDLLNSLVYIFIFGIRWVIPGLALISVASFFNYKMNGRVKSIIFALIYAITFFMMVRFIDQKMYLHVNPFLTTLLKNRAVGLFLTTAVSAICYAYGRHEHERDKEEMPFKAFMLAMLVNTILVQLIFVPFM